MGDERDTGCEESQIVVIPKPGLACAKGSNTTLNLGGERARGRGREGDERALLDSDVGLLFHVGALSCRREEVRMRKNLAQKSIWGELYTTCKQRLVTIDHITRESFLIGHPARHDMR